MARAKQCDRCCEFYIHYAGINGFSFEKLNDVGSVCSSATHDLCAACSKELTVWFNSGKKEESK